MRFDDGTSPNAPVAPYNILNDNGPNCDRFTGVCSICPYTSPAPTCSTPESYRGVMGYEAHCESYIASGAVWDMIQNLTGADGEAGWLWADRIWFESLPSMGSAYRIASGGQCNTNAAIDGCDGANWYKVLLGADDDDGNLMNGTPHAALIWTAFDNHRIACGSQPQNYDVCTEPAAPSLRIASSNRQLGLSWNPVENATGYVVYVNEIGVPAECTRGGWIPYQTVVSNYLTITDMRNDFDHSFALQALSGSADCVSVLSNCVHIQPSSGGAVNLTGIKAGGWDHVVVPTNDICDTSFCVRSATLNANAASSYINFKELNNTSVNAGSHVNRLYVDETVGVNDNVSSLNANNSHEVTNSSITLKGGRHLLKFNIDDGYSISESDESDNKYIITAIYEPYDLDTAPGNHVARTAPPDRDPEGFTHYSCDGYQFTVNAGGPDYWGAVGILQGAATPNYGLRLHDDYAGSWQGFANYLAWSSSIESGGVEIIGINRNNTSTATWWAGVIQEYNTPSSTGYTIHKSLSGDMLEVPSTNSTGTIPSGGVVAIKEIHVETADLNTYWRFAVTPYGGDIGIALINRTAAYFTIHDAISGTLINANGPNITEYFDIQFTTAGYYGLLIYKPNYTQTSNSIDYVINIMLAPPNLLPNSVPGWTDPLIPRDSAGCSPTSCTVSATLSGWSGSTYLNSTMANSGPNNVTVSFVNRYTLDDFMVKDITLTGLPSNNTSWDIDDQAIPGSKGGRHTLGFLVDANNTVLENNENDNNYYAQYVWSPRILTNNTPFETVSPPDRDSTGYLYYNCDGYQFSVTPDSGKGYWGVVGILPVDDSANYDLRLHNDYAGSTQGYGTTIVASNTGAEGDVELIGINRNQTSSETWWAGVLQGTNEPSGANYFISKSISSELVPVPSSSKNGNILAGNSVAIEEIGIDIPDLNITWQFSVTPTGGDIGIALMDRSRAYFALEDAIPGTWINANGSNTSETFQFRPTVSGFYGLVIYKPDFSQFGNNISYTVTITAALSNLRPYTRPGWSNPIVPRNITGCTGSSCTVTSTLPGWSGTTYLNSSSINDGPNDITIAFVVRYLLDDSTLANVSYGSLPAGSSVIDLDDGIGAIKGGRHTLGIFADADNTYSESNETDNTHYAQYVWSPMNIPADSAYEATAPPDYDSTGAIYPNCHGYQFTITGTWSMFAEVPRVATDNYNLRFHNDYTGSTNGFETPIITSANGAGITNFVLVNGPVAGYGPWYIGITQVNSTPGAGNYIVSNKNNFLPVTAPGTFGPYNLSASLIGTVHPVMVNANGMYQFKADITSGNADIAIAIFSSTANYYNSNEYLPGTYVDSNGAGQDETVSVSLFAGTYLFVVFKPTTAAYNSANSTDYMLLVTSGGLAETPDNNSVPGVPLTVSKQSSTQLLLNWGNSCDYVPGITHYEIYRGNISNLQSGSYNHVPFMCDSGSDTSEVINADSGSYYYLIVPTDLFEEGGYGFSSSGSYRPASASPCHPQNRDNC